MTETMLNWFNPKDQGLAKKAHQDLAKGEADVENLDHEKLEKIYEKFKTEM